MHATSSSVVLIVALVLLSVGAYLAANRAIKVLANRSAATVSSVSIHYGSPVGLWSNTGTARETVAKVSRPTPTILNRAVMRSGNRQPQTATTYHDVV
jgi:hypothetical protein